MLNHITLMGRLVADPELRTTPGGVAVATFRIAVDRDFKNKQTGERETDFITIVAWRTTAEFVSRYFAKGRMAVVEGRLQIRPYTDRDGNKRNATEVVAESVETMTAAVTSPPMVVDTERPPPAAVAIPPPTTAAVPVAVNSPSWRRMTETCRSDPRGDRPRK